MPPPKLSRDGPIAQILEPVGINFLVWNFGNEFRFPTRAQLSQSQIAQPFHATEPLG